MNGSKTCLITEQVSGNIFLRPVHGNKGTEVGNHTHNFDHTSFVITGSIHVAFGSPEDPGYREATYGPGEHFLVAATVKHGITMLEDGTRFVCIYSHRDPQGEVVQEYPGKGIPHREASPGSDREYQ
jgi:quercetin dioxygenase-like cupin family protein